MNDPCSICLESLPRDYGLLEVCLHKFCFECIKEWSHTVTQCPLCKTEFEGILHVSGPGKNDSTFVLTDKRVQPVPYEDSDSDDILSLDTPFPPFYIFNNHHSSDSEEDTPIVDPDYNADSQAVIPFTLFVDEVDPEMQDFIVADTAAIIFEEWEGANIQVSGPRTRSQLVIID